MKKNIEVILSGGLGNQLFQYAFGKWLSVKTNRHFILNIFRLRLSKQNETPRPFALRDLNLKSEIVEIHRLVGKSRVIDFLLRKFSLFGYVHENQRQNGSVFWGHWLQQKYANEIRSELIEDFQYLGLISDKDQMLFNEVSVKRILSIHVRRGDYILNLKANAHHGSLDLTYFRAAIKKANELSHFDEIWCFSDDKDWCRKNLENVRVIQIENENPFVDLLLMSKCKGNIISNSTFSWWSAWLNTHEDKVVIAPQKWFRVAPNPDIYPSSWIKVENP